MQNISYADVKERLAFADEGKRDFLTKVSNLQFTPKGVTLIDEETDTPHHLGFDYHGLRQLYGFLAHPLDFTVETDDYAPVRKSQAKGIVDFAWHNPEVLPDIFNALQRKYLDTGRDATYLIRSKNNRIRAALSHTYKPVSNSQFALSILDNIEFDRITNFTLTPDFVDLRVLIKDYEDGAFGSGFIIVNDEIGLKSVSIAGMLKRTSCDNSLRSQSPQRFYHRGAVYDRIEDNLAQLPVQLELADQLFHKYKEAESEIFSQEDFIFLLQQTQKVENWSQDFTNHVIVGTEGRMTKQGFVDGMTYAAHKVYGGRPLRQSYYEDYASAYLLN